MPTFKSTDAIQEAFEALAKRVANLELQGKQAGRGSAAEGGAASNFLVLNSTGNRIIEMGENSTDDNSTGSLNNIEIYDDAGTLRERVGELSTDLVGVDIWTSTGLRRMRVGDLTSTGRAGMEIYGSSTSIVEMRAGALASDPGNFGVEVRDNDGELVKLGNAVTPQTDFDGSTDTTASTAYVGLGGPSVSVNIGPSGRALVTMAAQLTITFGSGAAMGFAVSGASTVAASDDNSLQIASDLSGSTAESKQLQASNTALITGLSTGTNTFTGQYRVTGSTGTFRRRTLVVTPF